MDVPNKIQWDQRMVDAFNLLRLVLCEVCCLHVPVGGDVFMLQTGASGSGVGGVLNVIRKGEVLPVGFYARQIRGAERRYSATELEILAIVLTVLYFTTSCTGDVLRW